MNKILTNLTIILFFCCCFNLSLKAQQALVCNDEISISFDMSYGCEIEIDTINIQETFLESNSGVVFDNLSLNIYASLIDFQNNNAIEDEISHMYVHTDLIYQVTDEDTGNSCWGSLNVDDLAAPIAICESELTIAIGEDGTATIFKFDIDAGSYDLCSDIDMEVRRQENSLCSGSSDDTEFSDKVTFYCCESGTTVFVELVVYDASGNTNTCVTSVQVIGNASSIDFTPPSDKTVSCSDNLNELDIELNDAFGSPVYMITEDNAPFMSFGNEDSKIFLGYYAGASNSTCSIDNIFVHDESSSLTACNTGSIIRSFTVVSTTQVNVYNQIIQVETADVEVLIEWPLDTLVCSDASIGNEEPTITSTACHLIANTYEDQVFINGIGTVDKIIRTWTVIDWCTNDAWTHNQIIDVDASLCGDCTLVCNDFINLSLGSDCEFTFTATDVVDIFLEGGIAQCPNGNLELHLFETAEDYTNGNFFAQNTLTIDQVGQTLFYEIEDQNSGNVCWGQLLVEDKIAPVPICFNALTIELPNGTESVEVWAEDLNAGSYDNCDENAIYFEIRRTSTQDCNGSIANVFGESLIVYCCDVNTSVEVEMLVIDESGNSDFCVTTIFVQGNEDCTPCEEGCVWPGDTNADGVANQFDLLNIGLAYDATGESRATANANWIGQNATDWDDTFIDNLNYKHADADGNGLVDLLDLFPLMAHWGSEHNFKDTEDQFITDADTRSDLQIYVEVDTFSSGSQVQLPIILENNETDLVDVYGIAFSVLYEQEKIIANSANIDVSNSWLGAEGTDLITVSKDFWSEGRIDVALSRTDGMNISGQGRICALDIIIEDVIFLNFGPQSEELIDAVFTIDNVRLVNNLGEEIPVNPSSTTSKITDISSSITPISETNFEVFPNPASDYLTIDLDDLKTANIDIIDINGRLIQTITSYNSKTKIDISTLIDGIYILQITDGSNRYISKLIKE